MTECPKISVGEQKQKSLQYGARDFPLISYQDLDGLQHAVEVDAETVYEAVALAIAGLFQDQIDESATRGLTEFTVTVYRRPIEHKIRLNQVQSGRNTR